MEATAAQGAWKKVLWQGMTVAALLGCAYLFPPLAFLAAFALPLWVCPAFAKGDIGLALVLPLAPTAACLMNAYDPMLTLCIPVASYLCLLGHTLAKRQRFSFTAEGLLYTVSIIVAALLMLLQIGSSLGGPLFSGLSERLVQRVQGSLLSGNILYALASVGFLPMPEAYRNAAGLQLGNILLLNPFLHIEFINMLRLRLTEELQLLIPTLLMQGSILCGFFSALRSERAQAKKTGNPQAAPVFRSLQLPRREQQYMLVLCIGTVLTSFSNQPLISLLCTLMYSAFATVFQLLGAAVLVYRLARRHPRRITLYGALAALLFLVFPLALFMLGMIDQFLPLRTASFNHQEEE